MDITQIDAPVMADHLKDLIADQDREIEFLTEDVNKAREELLKATYDLELAVDLRNRLVSDLDAIKNDQEE